MLQVLEEFKPRHDVVERTAIGESRAEYGCEGVAGTPGVTVDGHLALVFRLLRSAQDLGGFGNDLGVGAEGDDAVVVAIPVAIGGPSYCPGSRPRSATI